MAEVLQFTGGMRCKDCSEQIEPERLRLLPDTKRCQGCQVDHENAIKRARMGSRPQDIEIIRG